MTVDQQTSRHSFDDLEIIHDDDDDFNVENSIKASYVPPEGLQFQTHEKAYNFYNHFALTDGFAIRRYSTYKSRNSDVITRRTFVCNMEDNYRSCGVGPAKISQIINSTNSSGTDIITPQQCSDYLKIRRKNNIGKECMIEIQNFLERKARDSEFYYAIQLDDTRSRRSIFWCDARARKSYMKFCDVIVFDVTYKTNNFSMPFAPFTGVNHHRQSILLGCALLSDEQKETFIRLFDQWLKCIGNQAPGAIITDQDSAISNAMARMFPYTHHRYCKWHLGLHECEHILSLYCAYPTFNEDYNNWCKKSKFIEESEKFWIMLCEKYKPIYQGQLSETQKNMIKSWKWIEKFIEQYEKAIKSRRDTEEKEDLVSMTTTPEFTELHSLEAHAGRVYSRNIFKIFKDEFSQILHCQHNKGVKEGVLTTYEVDFKEKGRAHIVNVDISTKFCKCSCAKFETWGIPCKHILYTMKHKLRLKVITDEYILPRWTLNVRYRTLSTGFGHNEAEAESGDTCNSNVVTRLEAWTLRGDLNKLYEKAIYRKDLYESVVKEAHKLWKKIEEIEKIQMPPPLSNNVETNIAGECSQSAILCVVKKDTTGVLVKKLTSSCNLLIYI
ncbi:protein FAR1-RELATED SEQUENCE 7-like [Apium graveolens]|uniref:protein FAR1-RELATED SEQUENCE 7-like n=1 Tax=Apium graveolens TaxID=4045 RepID=UPI003D7AB935